MNRNKEITLAVLGGEPVPSIAEDYGLSLVRVRAIVIATCNCANPRLYQALCTPNPPGLLRLRRLAPEFITSINNASEDQTNGNNIRHQEWADSHKPIMQALNAAVIDTTCVKWDEMNKLLLNIVKAIRTEFEGYGSFN